MLQTLTATDVLSGSRKMLPVYHRCDGRAMLRQTQWSQFPLDPGRIGLRNCKTTSAISLPGCSQQSKGSSCSDGLSIIVVDGRIEGLRVGTATASDDVGDWELRNPHHHRPPLLLQHALSLRVPHACSHIATQESLPWLSTNSFTTYIGGNGRKLVAHFPAAHEQCRTMEIDIEHHAHVFSSLPAEHFPRQMTIEMAPAVHRYLAPQPDPLDVMSCMTVCPTAATGSVVFAAAFGDRSVRLFDARVSTTKPCAFVADVLLCDDTRKGSSQFLSVMALRFSSNGTSIVCGGNSTAHCLPTSPKDIVAGSLSLIDLRGLGSSTVSKETKSSRAKRARGGDRPANANGIVARNVPVVAASAAPTQGPLHMREGTHIAHIEFNPSAVGDSFVLVTPNGSTVTSLNDIWRHSQQQSPIGGGGGEDACEADIRSSATHAAHFVNSIGEHVQGRPVLHSRRCGHLAVSTPLLSQNDEHYGRCWMMRTDDFLYGEFVRTTTSRVSRATASATPALVIPISVDLLLPNRLLAANDVNDHHQGVMPHDDIVNSRQDGVAPQRDPIESAALVLSYGMRPALWVSASRLTSPE